MAPAGLFLLVLLQFMGSCIAATPTTWQTVGRASVDYPDFAEYPNLAFGTNGAPFLAYRPLSGPQAVGGKTLVVDTLVSPPLSWTRAPPLAGPYFSRELYLDSSEIPLTFRKDGSPVTAYMRANGSIFDPTTERQIYVQQYSQVSNHWVSLGKLAAQNAEEPRLAVTPDNRVLLAYRDTGNNIVVKRWSGASWVGLDGFGLPASKFLTAGDYAFALAPGSGTPYIAFVATGVLKGVTLNGEIVVTKYNPAPSAAGNWDVVGPVKASPSKGSRPSLKLSKSGAIVLAYIDAGAAEGLTVQQLSGASWTVLGGRGFVRPAFAQTYFSLAVGPAGEKFVAYATSTRNSLLKAVRWSGAAWAPICGGVVSGSADAARHFGLALSPPGGSLVDAGNTPHLAFVDEVTAGQRRLTVKRCG